MSTQDQSTMSPLKRKVSNNSLPTVKRPRMSDLTVLSRPPKVHNIQEFPAEVASKVASSLDPFSLMAFRRSNRRLDSLSDFVFKSLFEGQRLVLYNDGRSLRNLVELSESPYAGQVKRLIISAERIVDYSVTSTTPLTQSDRQKVEDYLAEQKTLRKNGTNTGLLTEALRNLTMCTKIDILSGPGGCELAHLLVKSVLGHKVGRSTVYGSIAFGPLENGATGQFHVAPGYTDRHDSDKVISGILTAIAISKANVDEVFVNLKPYNSLDMLKVPSPLDRRYDVALQKLTRLSLVLPDMMTMGPHWLNEFRVFFAQMMNLKELELSNPLWNNDEVPPVLTLSIPSLRKLILDMFQFKHCEHIGKAIPPLGPQLQELVLDNTTIIEPRWDDAVALGKIGDICGTAQKITLCDFEYLYDVNAQEYDLPQLIRFCRLDRYGVRYTPAYDELSEDSSVIIFDGREDIEKVLMKGEFCLKALTGGVVSSGESFDSSYGYITERCERCQQAQAHAEGWGRFQTSIWTNLCESKIVMYRCPGMIV